MVARRQLAEMGVGRGAIGRRLATGRLHRIHAGVYSVGHAIVTRRGYWMAALLASGPGALLSHRSAGALWEVLRMAGGPIDVIVPGRSRSGRPGVVAHRVRNLHEDDCAWCAGFPVTSVARTLLDLAAILPGDRLERAMEEAERLHILDVGAIQRLCERSRGHRGRAALLSLLASFVVPPDARSELERRFLDLCRRAGLPPPAANVLVAGHVVDTVWLGGRLVVELDGHAYHRTRAAFERDRVRDAALQLAGYRVLRITHRRLEREPQAILHEVRKLLATP